MESIEVAQIKMGQSVTLEIGDKEPILTKLEEPNKFRMEDWFDEETDIFLLNETIEEDELLYYTLIAPSGSLKEMLAENEEKFGADRTLNDFLGRVVEGIEMEEE
ncbi:hypothetical protein ACQZV8_07230 [Magnetococcales bacterium HHB-1]